MAFPCIKCKIHKYKNTKINKYKVLKNPTCAIFLKSMGSKDIKYDIPMYQMWNTQIQKHIDMQIIKYTNTKCLEDPTCAIFFKSMGFKDIKYDLSVYQMWNTQIHKYKVLRRPNMCYIFEKHGIQGYQIRHSRVSNARYTNIQICKYTKTKCLEDPTCAIFLKSMGFNDIKYDIHVYQVWNTQISK